MKKTHWVCAAPLLLAMMAAPIAAGTPQGQRAPLQILPRAAVIPFANITGERTDDWIGPGIAETVTADLRTIDGLAIIGRESILDVLRSAGSSERAEPDERVAMDLGRRLGATWLISGGYQHLGGLARVTARVVDVSTGSVVRTVKIDGAANDIFGLQDRLVAELRQGLRATLAALDTGTNRRELASATPDAGAGRVAPPQAVRAAEGGVPPRPESRQPATSTLSALVTPAAIDRPPAPVPPAVISRDQARRATVRAIRLTDPLSVDGKLDEAVYRSVPAISDFIQQLPREGTAPSEKTEAWVMFDRNYVYVAARCWDSAPPARWVANEMRRDTNQLRQNDQFGLLFDTFYDHRNGFQFYTNPLGAIADAQLTDEGNPNSDWNPVWEVRTGRFEGGWTVEMAIPFKSLRYRSGTSQVWGIQFRRAIRRKNEWIYLTPVPASMGGPGGIFRISAAATLVGLDLPPASKNLELKPYGISHVTTDRVRTPALSNDLNGDFGIDAKYGVTANLTADLTYNTDFAQVEVDEQQVNLTRFSLFFPEKREFFLEGRGIFDFGRGPQTAGGFGGGGGGGGLGGGVATAPPLFYSRRIGLNRGRVVPIDAGGRLTGKVGKFNVGVVNIQTGEESVSATRPTNFTVARVKRDILRRSSIGAMFTNRSVSTAAAGSNQALGVDTVFSFFQNVNLSGYFARTKTPGLEGKDASYQGRFEYGADRYGVQLEHLLVGDNFNPEVGFVRRDDFRRTFAALRFSPRPRSIKAVRKFTWQGNLEYILNGAGALETRQQEGRFNIEFENSDQLTALATNAYELLVQPFAIARGVVIPAGGYQFSDGQVTYALGAQRRASGTFLLQRGHFYSGTITAVGFSGARVSVTRHFSLEPNVSYNWVDLPEGEFTTRLFRTRADYAFTPRMFASALVQYNYSDNTFSSNLRIRWEYHPGSELFVVYTDERDTIGVGVPGLKNRAFVVKINRLFRF